MSTYLIQSETLTNLGDEIRELGETTGTKTPAQMTTLVDGANGTIDSQATLINQIKTALEGKGSGSSKPETTFDVTPDETIQTITPPTGYVYSGGTVQAISSTYVGSGIARKSSSDLTVSGATVSVPIGYYSAAASKSVASGTAGTPTASKGTVSNHSISITPSVTNTTGYITGGTKTGTAVTVSASELVSGSETKTANGTYNVTNLASLIVAIPTYDGSVS